LYFTPPFLVILKRKLSSYNLKEEYPSLISRVYQQRTSFSLVQFAVLFAIAYVFYGYFLTHFSLSIDSEYGAFRATSANAGLGWIGQGRWLCYFLEKYLFTQPVVPYAPHFLFCCGIALSYLLILSAYKLQNRFLTYFTYPLFCAFPVWLFLLAFYANIVGAVTGMLLVSTAIFIFSLYKNTLSQIGLIRTKCVFPFCIQALLLAMAIGTYQAFLLVYVVIGLGLILLHNPISSNRKELFSMILYFGSVVVFGLLLYFLINRFALWLVPSNTAYIDGFMDWQGFFEHPLKVTRDVFEEAYSYYSGSTAKYGGSLSFTGILLIATSIIMFAHWRKKANMNIIQIILWVLVLIAPFAFNFISTGSVVPTRSLLAVPCVIWLAAVIGYTLGRDLAKIGILVIVFILEFQILQVSGLYAAATEIVGMHDRALAASLYERIGVLSKDGCQDTPCKVDVFGLYHITTPYPVAWSSTMGASFFEWDGGNIYRMLAFMHLLGYNNLVAAPSQENTPIFEKMPVWPAAGSVIKYKDTYLVKLNDNADPHHSPTK
ncbi:MAG: glucosyltransferase domain-containing protein, partial [Gammaproteobacteria bacterium]|nr:glucosyltransferase domain-containing protein [Gammaproteobacteria bacterium]